MKEPTDAEIADCAVRATIHALGFDPLTCWLERPTGATGMRVMNEAGPVCFASNAALAEIVHLTSFASYLERDLAGKVKRPPPRFVMVNAPRQDELVKKWTMADTVVALMATKIVNALRRTR